MPRIAGASIRSSSDKEPTELLVADLQSIGTKLGDELFTHKNYKLRGGSYSISTFQHHFGSWDNALKVAGFVSGKVNTYTDDELFDELQKLWEQIGEQPTFDQMSARGNISPQTYHKRFGSWTKAIHAFCNDRDNEPDAAKAEKSKPINPPGNTKRDKSGSIKAVFPPSNDKLQRPSTSANNVASATQIPLSHQIVVRQTGRQVPARLRWNVFQRDGFTCRACGRSPKEHGVAIEADHILAYTNGGETIFENLQTLCRDCNVGKSNRRTPR